MGYRTKQPTMQQGGFTIARDTRYGASVNADEVIGVRRREFIALASGAVVAWSSMARAQQPGKVWRVGQVIGGTPETVGHLARAVEERLRDLGYVQDRNIALYTQYAVPRLEAMERAIQSLIPNIDVLLVWGTIGGASAKKLGVSMPVVFASVGAPVDIGLVQSLSNPGTNMTGITFEAASETYGRRLQLLKEITPSLSRIAVLSARGDPNARFAMTSLEASASILGVTLVAVEIASADELTAAFSEMQRSKAEALIVVAGVLTYPNGKKIADLALTHQLPSCHGFKEAVLEGGLVSLGPDLVVIGQQAASYVDKILRGAIAAELPVQQPSRYEVYLNLVWGDLCQGGSARVLSFFIVGFLVRSESPFPRPDHALDSRRRAQERSGLAALAATGRLGLDGSEHDGTLGCVGMTIGGEPACRARGDRRATSLYSVGPETRTMMQ